MCVLKVIMKRLWVALRLAATLDVCFPHLSLTNPHRCMQGVKMKILPTEHIKRKSLILSFCFDFFYLLERGWPSLTKHVSRGLVSLKIHFVSKAEASSKPDIYVSP